MPAEAEAEAKEEDENHDEAMSDDLRSHHCRGRGALLHDTSGASLARCALAHRRVRREAAAHELLGQGQDGGAGEATRNPS
jgi:hypothetical protein